MPAPTRIGTDDVVYRVKRVWLGPVGWTLPWHARYLAYGLFVGIFPPLWGVFALCGYRTALPLWPAALAILAVYSILLVVDHDLSVLALAVTIRSEMHARRRHKPDPTTYTNTKVTVL